MCHEFKHKLCSPKTKLIKELSVLAHLNQELSVLGTVPFVLFDNFHEFNFWANDTEYMKFPFHTQRVYASVIFSQFQLNNTHVMHDSLKDDRVLILYVCC